MTAADCVRRLRDALLLALDALPDSDTAGPNGTGYAYAWDELNGDEQEWVKSIRAELRTALEDTASCEDASKRPQP